MFLEARLLHLGDFCRKIMMLVGLIALSLGNAYAQQNIEDLSDQEFNEIKSSIDPFVDKHLPKVTQELSSGDTSHISVLFEKVAKDTNQVSKSNQAILKAEQDKLNNSLGLGIRADYRENLNRGAFTIESGGFYKRRAKFQFSWDVLKNGLVENQNDAKRKENELAISKLRETNKLKKESVNKLFATIVYLFNMEKYQHLVKRKKILNKQLALQQKLFNKNMVLWDNVVSTISKKNETESMLKNFNNYNEQFNEQFKEELKDKRPLTASADAGNRNALQKSENHNPMVEDSLTDQNKAELLPIVDIDIQKAISDVKNEQHRDSILDLRKRNFDLAYDPLTELSLSASIDYNIYNNPELYQLESGRQTATRDFFSFGVTFSAPIPFGIQRKQKIKQAKIDRLKNIEEDKAGSKVKEVMNYYYEYQYKLKDYIEFYHKRSRLLEKIRQSTTKATLDRDYYNPVELLNRMELLSTVNFELFDIKQQMYLKLLQIYPYLNNYSLAEVCEPIDVGKLADKRMIDKSVYIWSKGFAEYDNDVLIDYLKNQRIKRVMLSLGAGDRNLKPKARVFIASAKKNDIKVDLMIGNNYLFLEKRRDKLRYFIEEASELGVGGVHLDVEPHANDEWKGRRSTYMELYAEMVKYANGRASEHDLDLSVSVPLFYNKEILQQVYDYTDKVFLMAYKQKDTEYLKRKIIKELDVDTAKTVIALRAKDFEMNYGIEKFMVELYHKTDIRDYAVHDLRDLIKLQNFKPGKRR